MSAEVAGIAGAPAETPTAADALAAPAGSQLLVDQSLQLRRATRMDDAGVVESVVCELSNGSCVRMSLSAYWLYRELQRGCTAEQIAAGIRQRFGQTVSSADVAVAGAALLERVREESQAVSATARRRYVFRIRLATEPIVERAAAPLSPLLSVPAVIAWMCFISVSAVWFWTASASAIGLGRINLGTAILIGYFIYLTTLIAHELGHAAACFRYGVPPGDIGFAIYLVFPALYCDATRAWLLPRRERLVVDFAGVLFEVGLGSVYSDLGIVLHQPSLVVAAMMVLGNLLVVLNPLGRFDSYWMLSDALGIADLSRQRSRALRRLIGRRGDTDSVGYRTWQRAFIAGYSAVTIFIIAWFGYSAARFTGPFLAHLSSDVAAIGRDFEAGRLGSALAALASTVPGLMILVVIAYRLARSIASRIRKSGEPADSSDPS